MPQFTFQISRIGDGLGNFRPQEADARRLTASFQFVKRKAHINGIENFWGLAKMRLAKFCGLNRATLRLHLKECEFRFNHRRDNLYQLLLKEFKNNPLN